MIEPLRISFIVGCSPTRGIRTWTTPLGSDTDSTIGHEGWERPDRRPGTERRDRTGARWSAIVGRYTPACGAAAG